MQGNYKDIIKIAAPVMLASIAQSSISFTDTAFLGKISNVYGAAIGIVSVYYLFFFMLGFSYTKSTQILVARRVGENNLPGVGEAFDNSLATILGFGLVLFLMMRFGTAPALTLMIKDPEIRRAGIEWLEWRSYGIAFSLVGSVLLSFYMGINRVIILAFGVVSMAGLNIFLNYGLIYGKFGMPAMGISGSALASNIAEVYACVLFLGYTVAMKFQSKYKLFHYTSLSLATMKRIAKLAGPIVAQAAIGLVAWGVFFYFVEKMGQTDAAISSYVKSLYMFFGLFAWGFSTSANTIISTLMGGEKHERVIAALKNIVMLSFGFQVLVCIPLAIFPEWCVGLFTNDKVLIAGCVPVVYVCIAALLVYSVATTLFHGIVSTGSVNSSLRIEIVTVALYLVFVGVIFHIPGKTVTIVWLAEVFYWVVLGGLTFAYLASGRWKKTVI